MTSLLRWTSPRWRLVVLAVGLTGIATVIAAVVDVAARGLTRPLVMLIGFGVTIAINRIYVVVARRGGVLEGIDVAEVPIVALALALPPGEALLTFVAGSVVVEALVDRAVVKKLFNCSLRATGAGVLLGVAHMLTPFAAPPSAGRYVAVAVGGLAYTLVNDLWLAAVVSSVERATFVSVFVDGARTRAAISVASITIGLTAGRLENFAPLALIGLAAPLVLLAAAVRAARRTERERDRLQSVLDATSRIQLADDPDVQEAALVDAARELLLWKDVEVRTLPPGEGEIGGRLPMREGVDRWLVSRPRVDSDPWTTDDEMVIEALTNAASAALERARLQQEMGRLALIDPLTGVANRRHMDEALVSLLNPTHRRQFALLVLDLDDFKSINDDLGHEAGDRVLQIVAERLRRSVRADDLVARLGGDEFVVVLPAVASRSVVRAIIDTIRSRVAQPVGIGDDTIAVTVSVGYAIAPVEGSTAVDLMRAADRRMYKSKSSTRGAAQLPTPREGVELLLP